MMNRERNFSVRDTALRAVGRNLINFQKLEHCLKALVRLGHIAGPMSTIEGALGKRISKSSEFTLGKAIREWLRVAAVDEAPRSTTQDLFEPWISMSVESRINPERLTEHGEALNALAVERNNLVHQDLANFNFDSEQGCRDLVVKLDGQNARILEQLTFLTPAIKGLIERRKWAGRPETQDELFDEIARQLNSGGT